MQIAFILSMPNVGSWNGKWTASHNFHARVRKFTKSEAEKILKKENYHYNFGDGWSANVKVKKVMAKEANQIRKNAKGFCGYEWMIDSIIDHGTIKTD
jgi:hypothetical protein